MNGADSRDSSRTGLWLHLDDSCAYPSLEAFTDAARTLLLRRCTGPARRAGERVREGDRVRVDRVALRGEAIIPFSVREGEWLDPDRSVHASKLYRGVVGVPVGRAALVQGPDPDDPSLGPVVYVVDIREARPLESAEDPEAWAVAAGYGSGADLAKHAMARVWEQTRLDLETTVANRVLEQTLQEDPVPDPSTRDIDTRILARWERSEGDFLLRRGWIQAAEASRSAWLKKRALREEAAWELRKERLLDRTVQQEGIRVPEPEAEAALAFWAGSVGLKPEALKRWLELQPERGLELLAFMLRRRALAWLVARVQVQGGPPEKVPPP